MDADLADLAVRIGPRLEPNPRRVITKLFVPGEEALHGRSRAAEVVARVLALDEEEVASLARAVVADYGARHQNLDETLSNHFAFVARDVPDPDRLTADRRTLLGAYFTHEYSTEAAALCNPSMAAHPDQSDLSQGQLRFVMTVRSIGEGHISSIGFRTGVVGPGMGVTVDEPAATLVTGIRRPGTYRKRLFLSKLADFGGAPADRDLLLGSLPDTFTDVELETALSEIHEHSRDRAPVRRAIDHVHRVASSIYGLEYPPGTELSARLVWPTAQAERNGMEDARLVRFHDGGAAVFHATYTAYDGASIATHLLTTTDFVGFEAGPLAGKAAQNKGLALFPRRIHGRYYALSRWDRENLAIADSDDCRIWERATTLHQPRQGWELVQVGNGGSPIETPQGWLVITHGVGPMRTYALGAILLDIDNPAVVVASLPGPLLTPNPGERDGYVPNVVYTCGALLHDGVLTIPYGISDGSIGFAQLMLAELLARMVPGHR
jgi:predicted GH43/DUF377 family glycosyl hydrolase